MSNPFSTGYVRGALSSRSTLRSHYRVPTEKFLVIGIGDRKCERFCTESPDLVSIDRVPCPGRFS